MAVPASRLLWRGTKGQAEHCPEGLPRKSRSAVRSREAAEVCHFKVLISATPRHPPPPRPPTSRQGPDPPESTFAPKTLLRVKDSFGWPPSFLSVLPGGRSRDHVGDPRSFSPPSDLTRSPPAPTHPTPKHSKRDAHSFQNVPTKDQMGRARD